MKKVADTAQPGVDEFDLARLLLQLENNNGWTLVGGYGVERRWVEDRGQLVTAHFSPGKLGARVKVYVQDAGATHGPFTNTFRAEDFEGPTRGSAAGSKFYQFITWNLDELSRDQGWSGSRFV
jgi:hypothetical protein